MGYGTQRDAGNSHIVTSKFEMYLTCHLGSMFWASTGLQHSSFALMSCNYVLLNTCNAQGYNIVRAIKYRVKIVTSESCLLHGEDLTSHR